ncbi:hypothetical protein A2926_03110 [Candidatus Giovannonibacteria bacterium RIFCSPLOWO2_01_FULL_44_40]|uniref:Uncharacterized protein n=1 Tax=Candidatus Giovannonibacteria bacterium RIFCSPHIGHO2_01_FULL_45_23 TaxID=1798325 RepID=A0A1F5VFM4_9BACT|nr:MAG: hypothetical protein A2834_00770 [Candidatus Giovannonibacteria bacterium RIFCSPHIGHO2_01_FULL_45_23]OGF75757.1 MAG: hypothetical protein A3C77_02495 [Candidatus Giovannonibacteria bacterium RIFCSPHIGHO2_02_FULL_45_13]OGF79846.1 MAG: hypothetical protein A2926_03110 [Candidatus Giovannonibacteria bacterium RIFCSPLOWO2_01_FULL_44_40]
MKQAEAPTRLVVIEKFRVLRVPGGQANGGAIRAEEVAISQVVSWRQMPLKRYNSKKPSS